MGTVNLKEARKRLGELVRAAERGERVTITRRGRKIARIVPVENTEGHGLPSLAEFRASIEIKGKAMSKTVAAMRSKARY